MPIITPPQRKARRAKTHLYYFFFCFMKSYQRTLITNAHTAKGESGCKGTNFFLTGKLFGQKNQRKMKIFGFHDKNKKDRTWIYIII